MDVRFISSIAGISRHDWESVCGTNHPFTRYEFLNALEQSGAVSPSSGWHPHHALVYHKDELVAVLPSYLKDHSYGEFVFDFQWAEAYQRHQMDYYPKLLSAIPFSPVTGPRICIKPGFDQADISRLLVESFKSFVSDKSLSSFHLLFLEQEAAHQLTTSGLLLRRAVHFQWFNHAYVDFTEFLCDCNSRHRKNIRKERQRVLEVGISLQRLEGHEITEECWEQFYHFYQLTYLKRSGHGGYLAPSFFRL